MKELKKKDRKILAQLDADARMPVTQVAKKARISREVADYHIGKLEDDNIITGYYPVLNMGSLGYHTIRTYLRIIRATRRRHEEIMSFIDEHLGAAQIFLRDGDYDIGFISWHKDIAVFEKKLAELKKRFTQFIDDIQISILTSMKEFTRGYLGSARLGRETVRAQETADYDDTDIAILRALSSDARMKAIDIAQHAGVSARVVAYRLRKLQDTGLLLGTRADIDIAKIGMHNYYLEFQLDDLENLSSLRSEIELHENTIFTVSGLLCADFEAEMEFASKQELLAYLDELRTQFPWIREIRYASTISYYKLSYLPDTL